MATVAPSLAGTDWLSSAEVRAVFAVLEQGGDEARIVGGAVRNALFGVPVVDIDFATTAPPDRVSARAEAAGLKVVPTGIDHGTVTVLVGRHPFEVTTLREDISTDGRHAVVRFGRDWEADARRRDFTVNALSVSADGRVHDSVEGYGDIVARRIRFIGDADQRIAEDRLRVLRFFRFHAEYGRGELDPDGLCASIRARNGLRDLSAERIGQEMRRLVVASGAPSTVRAMQDTGILPVVLGGVGYVASFARLAEAEALLELTANVSRRLAGLGCRIEEDALRITGRLRLSNAERDRMLDALAAVRALSVSMDEKAARQALYRHGEEAYRDAVVLTWAWSGSDTDEAIWRDLHSLPERWRAPAFPLRGRDVVGGTMLRGPEIGNALKALEDWWIENDFAPDEAALKSRLQQMDAVR